MSAQGPWINTPLMLRQAACAERSARVRASRSELTDMIDASEPESCPECGRAPERGCECASSECARLLASSY